MTKKPSFNKKIRTPIPKLRKVLAELQQEINSLCPLCFSEEVGVFELHHIDENPAHNEKNNLLLVCPTCHAKIDKKIVSMEMVRNAKTMALNRNSQIEFVSAIIDEEQCRWYQKNERCFYKGEPGKPEIPVIGFTLINHSPKTVVMKTIRMFAKHLPSGLSGIPHASALKSAVKYRLCITKLGEKLYPLRSPLQIPAGLAAKFDTEIYCKMVGDLDIAPVGRYVLYLSFYFNGNNILTAPPVFLNCSGENEPLMIMRNIG
ncbi:HNH endonuclease signature motif containing protein [Niastella populi]|uniref:HNH nuclease domain-containing protein n=1 Tax=Niastella populi TaxID=550983 RepID=A0A1V9FDL9_9BACT|nr:HNH endonuclease signature motif containing protein [Niastella populi]OQP56450.1 hypothetical protein A4R26_04630 [Niastella populi]